MRERRRCRAGYGANGRATISNAQGTAILVYDTAGVRIANLVVTGAGRDVNTGSGILFYNDLAGDLLLAGVSIEQVDVSGFGDYGIEIGGWNNRSGFRSVRIEAATVRENGLGGLLTYAFQRAVHRDVYVGSTRAFLNAGFSGLTVNSGSGIVLGGVEGGTIERSVAYSNGWRSTASEGPVGIWAYDSNGVVIQFNESYDNRTGGPADGGGFDLDSGTSNSVLQYSYSHANDGAGFMLAHGRTDRIHAGNVVRYNVSQNDGRRNKYGGIHLWGRITSAEICRRGQDAGSGSEDGPSVNLAPRSSRLSAVGFTLYELHIFPREWSFHRALPLSGSGPRPVGA